jgi:hypothetical protein
MLRVGWEVPSSRVLHAIGAGEGGTFFLDFQNCKSPNTTNDQSQVLVVHSQFYSIFKHPLTTEPEAKDLEVAAVLIPTISLLRLTYLYLLQFFPEVTLQDFTTKRAREIVIIPILISFPVHCSLLHFIPCTL